MSRRIYICGPMRGRPENNVPAFNSSAERFRALGWLVRNPVDISLDVEDEVRTVDGRQPIPADFLRADVRTLAHCDAIAVLPEWEHSTGARCEVAVAITLGLAFFDAQSTAPIATPEVVVIRGGYERPAGPVDTLDSLRVEVNAWQAATFPQATPKSTAKHLVKEALELLARPEDLEEAADVAFLLFANTRGRDLVGAIRAKLEKNKARTWGQPDGDGVVEHVAEGTHSAEDAA